MARKTKEEANCTRQQIIDAARAVFHEHGVSRSTLEQVAQTAGLTRGAVYWHFENKAELFHAMHEDAFVPMRERVDAILFSTDYENPLDAIEAALQEIFRVLKDCPALRQVFEIMVLRCEYVDEFADVQAEANKPAMEFLEKVERAYQTAAAKGALRPGLDPLAVARDTWAFANGLLHVLLGGKFENKREHEIAAMISIHMALRRPS
jgi:TetR/AcrR family acrAB operon transcriptional repressor